MEHIEFNGQSYPLFQTTGNASRFAIPFAKEFCFGEGLDIGCCKPEWCYPGATPIDIEFDDPWDAYNLPTRFYGPGKTIKWDYIYSSHCLEHLQDWVGALDYWCSNADTIFLYLPHYDQEYWRPWNNRKHITSFLPFMLKDYFTDKGYHHFVSEGWDLNHSFYAVAST